MKAPWCTRYVRAYRKHILLFAVWITLTIGLSAQDTRPDASDEEFPITVTEIEIVGNERTRDRVILHLLDIEVGATITAADRERGRRELVDSELFAEVDIAVERDPLEETPTGRLVVTVVERWTLIPIPFFSSDGDDVRGGLFLLESNLLGLDKQAAIAGNFGSNGFSGFIGYIDPSIAFTRWNGRATVGFQNSEITARTPDGDLIRSYDAQITNGAVGIGYSLSDQMKIGTAVTAATVETSNFRAGLDDEEVEDHTSVVPALELAFDNTVQRSVLRYGLRTTVGGSIAATPDFGAIGRALVSYAFEPVAHHRMLLLASGGYGEMPVGAEDGFNGGEGFRTLPNGESFADRYGSGVIEYELPLLDQRWGVITFAHYWEGGAYDTEAIDAQPFYGFGGALRVYLRYVAIPALRFDAAYNLEAEEMFYNFTLGFAM